MGAQSTDPSRGGKERSGQGVEIVDLFSAAVAGGPAVKLDPKNRTVLIPVDAAAIPGLQEQFSPPGRAADTFDRKEEFHITAVGFQIGREIASRIKSGDTELESKIQTLIAETDWSFRMTGERYVVSRSKEVDAPRASKQDPVTKIRVDAESVVELVDMPGLAEFHRKLGAILGREIDTPPAHVTLYTRNDKTGIGFSSMEQWNTTQKTKLAPS